MLTRQSSECAPKLVAELCKVALPLRLLLSCDLTLLMRGGGHQTEVVRLSVELTPLARTAGGESRGAGGPIRTLRNTSERVRISATLAATDPRTSARSLLSEHKGENDAEQMHD